MEYFIGILLAIIVIIIVGLILRKRVYDEVDRQEGWKMDIMNRNITSQLSRIKKLNLSGETQEKFESWKERWELILSKELPDIEEYLFDAEEAADRYRFPTAKKTLRKSDQVLHSIEKDIEKILLELEELMESEESSRKEIEHIQPTIKELRKQLSQNRFQYGKAEVRFEVELDELDESLHKYHELVNSGNYLEGKTLVDTIKEELSSIETVIQEFPAVYKAFKQELPSQIDDLYNGIKEMKEDGYRVEHLGFEKEIHNYQQRILDFVNDLEKGETSEAKVFKEELDERIQEMYQLLEKEAIAKNFMETQIPSYQESLDEIAASFNNTKTDVEELKKTYYFDDQDMEKYLSLEQSIAQLHKQFEEILNELEDSDRTHTELREKLEVGFEQLDALKEKHDDFKLSVYNLRKDEIEAKEKLSDMRDQLQQVHRKVKKSNIPGVPEYIWKLSNDATEKNKQVLESLDKHPLDIAGVQRALSEAQDTLNQLVEQTDDMLEQAQLTEQVIQYANRYRSKYPILAAKLSESESLFRSYEYELALETAVKALKEVDPNALEYIEENRMIIH
ncbi:septation ring formation regulator EzrA [Ornithinibacillus halophilus]|uniref:Septation ring formation regulator EzrA n=1 Tax=Ornithinibacillus halophilus TaxID=930117 RepID=A0A1M5EJN2_9BACI|nr:septation ring formation regulator EzrA [Ornithinibacillus halophilus]SHF79435.1 septation ring formation regulator [Ornithinibacillus halophilus]